MFAAPAAVVKRTGARIICRMVGADVEVKAVFHRRAGTEFGGYVVLLRRLCTTGRMSRGASCDFVTAFAFRRKCLFSWFFIHVNKK
jgi:hypothetical protein